AEELGDPGAPRRPAAEAEPPGRRDRRLAESAGRRHGINRSRETAEEDRRRAQEQIVTPGQRPTGVRWELGVVALGIVTACAPKPPSLPAGASTPFPDFQSAYSVATAACGRVSTITLTA